MKTNATVQVTVDGTCREISAPIQFDSGAAAEFSGISARTLRRFREEGDDGPPYRRLRGHIYYDATELRSWIESHPLQRTTRENA